MLKLASDSLHLATKHTVPCTFGANMAKQKACKAQWCHYKTRFAAREKITFLHTEHVNVKQDDSISTVSRSSPVFH